MATFQCHPFSLDKCMRKGIEMNSGDIDEINDLPGVLECKDKCVNINGCTAYLYYLDSKVCKLKSSLARIQETNAKTTGGRLFCQQIFGEQQIL